MTWSPPHTIPERILQLFAIFEAQGGANVRPSLARHPMTSDRIKQTQARIGQLVESFHCFGEIIFAAPRREDA